MSFGYINIFETFQLAMDIILASVKWRHAIVDIHDTTMFLETLELHMQPIENMFTHIS